MRKYIIVGILVLFLSSTTAYSTLGTLLGYVDGYKVFYSKYYKVTVVDSEGRVVWSIPLRYYSSAAIGKDFLIVANVDEDMYKVNVTIYLPKTNETFQYSFPIDRPKTIIKVVANGSYAVVGVSYTWMLYYFKREKLLWEGSLSIECGYEDYPYFTLHLSRNGFGYAISSDGCAVTYFSPNMWGAFLPNKNYCLSFVEGPPKNLSQVLGAEILTKCLVLKMKYKGKEKGIYFYRFGTYNVDNFTFKAEYTENTLANSEYLLAFYKDYIALFNCSGEVLRIKGTFNEVYLAGEGFALVKYRENEVYITLLTVEEKPEVRFIRAVLWK